MIAILPWSSTSWKYLRTTSSSADNSFVVIVDPRPALNLTRNKLRSKQLSHLGAVQDSLRPQQKPLIRLRQRRVFPDFQNYSSTAETALFTHFLFIPRPPKLQGKFC